MKRLVLAALALAVVAAGAWLLGRHEERQWRRDRAEARLLDYDDRQVAGLALVVHGEEWRFERDAAAGWRLVAPVEDTVEEEELQELLRASRRATVVQVVEQPGALSDFGLDPPRGILRLAGVEVPELRIGNPSPTGDGLYAQVAGRPGVLVLSRLETGPLGDLVPETLREAHLSNVLRNEVDRIVIRHRGNEIRLSRDEADWWIDEPLRLPAHTNRVERLLSAVESAEVRSFLDRADPADPRFGLGERAIEIELRTEGTARRFRLGSGTEDMRYATRDDRPAVLEVAATGLDDLPIALDTLVADRLTHINRYLVTRFSYERAGDSLSASRTGQDQPWSSAEGQPLEDGPVFGLLVRLLGAGVAGYRTGAVGDGPPVATLDFALANGVEDRIRFFDERYARVDSLPHVTFRLTGPPPPIPATLVE